MGEIQTRWVQDLTAASQDKRVVRVAVQPPAASEVIGVDGNHEGSLRPFPGFIKVHELGFVDEADVRDYRSNLLDFQPVQFRIGSDGYAYGFVYRLQRIDNLGDPGDKSDILIDYYNSLAGAWANGVVLRSGLDLGGQMTAVTMGRYLFVFVESEGVAMLYLDPTTPWAPNIIGQSSLTSQPGPGMAPKLWSPDLALASSVGVGTITNTGETGPPLILDTDRPGQAVISIEAGGPSSLSAQYPGGTAPQSDDLIRATVAGDYALAYVLYHSQTGRYSALSDVAQIREADFSGSPGYLVIDIVYDSSKFDQALIYRSVRTQSAGGTFTAAILHLDKLITLEDYESDNSSGLDDDNRRAVYFYELEDKQLIFQDQYMDRGVFDEEVPPGGAAAMLDTTLVVANVRNPNPSAVNANREGDGSRGLGELRWSSLTSPGPELFPPLNRYQPAVANNPVVCLRECGGNLIGFSRDRQYFIRKESIYLRVQEMHEGFGVVGPNAADTVGSMVYLVTPKGVKAVSADMALDDVRSLNRLVMDEWSESDLEDISVSYDAALSALFILNPAEEHIGVLWFNSGKVTEVINCPFLRCAGGVWPILNDDGTTSGGNTLVNRTFFIQPVPLDGEDTDSDLSSRRPRVHIVDHRRLKTGPGDAPRYGLLQGDGAGDTLYTVDNWDNTTGRLEVTTVGGGDAEHSPEGMYLYVVQGPDDLVGQKLKVKYYDDTGALDLFYLDVGSWDVLPDPFTVEGLVLSLNPVYVRWVGTPLGMQDDSGPGVCSAVDCFKLRVAKDIGAYFPRVDSQVPEEGAAYVRYAAGTYSGTQETPHSRAYPRNTSGSNLLASIVEGDPKNYVATGDDFEATSTSGKNGVQATAHTPFFETFIADVDYEVPAIVVGGSVTDRARSGRAT